jgi:hypothetical protein
VKLRCVLCAVVFSATLCLSARSAVVATEPGRIALRYELYGFAGVHFATNRTTLDETDGRYSITVDSESRGAISMLVSLATHSEAFGRIAVDGLHPQSYEGEVLRNGLEAHNWVNYGPNDTVTGGALPTPKTNIPVTPAMKRGTVDQLTAFLTLDRQVARTGSCALTVAVYDGRRRYNLQFSDLPSQEETQSVKPNIGTHECGMHRDAIAGFIEDSGRGEGAYEGKLWYARPLADDLMVPVRMEFETEFGSVTGHLAELTGRGNHLQFGE